MGLKTKKIILEKKKFWYDPYAKIIILRKSSNYIKIVYTVIFMYNCMTKKKKKKKMLTISFFLTT